MHAFRLVLFIIFSGNYAFAQVSGPAIEITGKIKGTVLDATDQTRLGYVSITVQELKQSQPTRNTLTRADGSFEITNLPAKQYQLVFTYVGYQEKIISMPILKPANISLGNILLVPKPTQLKEVQVNTNKLLLEQDFDKIIYHVENDPEKDILNSLDMLRKVPMLTVDAEDNLLLQGTGNYQVLVNGQRSALFSGNPTDVFKSLPAGAIKKIEVITNPSARYAADGIGGIINIVTHKNSIGGYNGSVSLATKQPGTYLANGLLTTKQAKFGSSMRFSHNATANPANKSTLFREEQVKQHQTLQTGESKSNSKALNAGGEVSYEPNPQTTLTGSVSLSQSTGHHQFLQEVVQRSASGSSSEAYNNRNTGRNKNLNHDFNLFYEQRFRKNNQQQFSLSFNRLTTGSRSLSDLNLQPGLNHSPRVSTTENNEDSREYLLEANYVQPLAAQTLELGVKSSLQQNSSHYFNKNQVPETGAFLLDSSASNNFNYNQQVHAAFASLDLRKSLWGLRTGIRLEETILQANFKSSGTYATPHYLNVFPALTLTRRLKNSGTIKLSYNRRLQRPDLYSLNPYVDQTDPLNISFGNPDLRPAVSHVVQLAYHIFTKGFSGNASLFHYFTNNAIQAVTTLGADSIARTTFGNLGQDQNYGLSVSSNMTVLKHLNLNLNSSTQFVKYTSFLEGIPHRNAGITYNFQGSTTYRFKKGWRASGNINYNSPQVFFQGKSAAFGSGGFALNKVFLKNKNASINLAVRSPFRKYRRSFNAINGVGFYQQRESFSVIRQFQLAFSYRFGKLQGQ